jgi:hypothetical protein
VREKEVLQVRFGSKQVVVTFESQAPCPENVGVALKDKELGQRRVNKGVPECANPPEASLAQLSQFRSLRELIRGAGVHF